MDVQSFHIDIGHATAGIGIGFDHGDLETGLAEIVRGDQSCNAGADDDDSFLHSIRLFLLSISRNSSRTAEWLTNWMSVAHPKCAVAPIALRKSHLFRMNRPSIVCPPNSQ